MNCLQDISVIRKTSLLRILEKIRWAKHWAKGFLPQGHFHLMDQILRSKHPPCAILLSLHPSAPIRSFSTWRTGEIKRAGSSSLKAARSSVVIILSSLGQINCDVETHSFASQSQESGLKNCWKIDLRQDPSWAPKSSAPPALGSATLVPVRYGPSQSTRCSTQRSWAQAPFAPQMSGDTGYHYHRPNHTSHRPNSKEQRKK